MINLTENSSVASNKTAVALGVFDGIHRGHQAVINRAVSFKEKGLSPAVFTFNTKTVTSKGNGKIDMLISDELKLEKLEELGVEYVYSPQFSEIKGLTAERFVKEIIVDKFKAEVVVCGENFRFRKVLLQEVLSLQSYVKIIILKLLLCLLLCIWTYQLNEIRRL